MLIEVDADSFEAELAKPDVLVLLACYQDSPLGGDHGADVLEAARRLEGLAVCLRPSEKDWDVFRAKWWIGGTPTYVLFRSGREIARRRGRAGAQELADFVMSAMG